MKTDDLIRLLAEDAEPAPSLTKRVMLALTAGMLASAALFFATMHIRTGLTRPEVAGPILMKLAVTLPFAFAGVLIAWRTLQPGRNARALRWLWLVPITALTAALAWEISRLGFQDFTARLMGRDLLGCMIGIPLFSALPLVGLLWAFRRGAPTEPENAGLLAGFGAAGLGASLFALHCPNDSPLFILAWYSFAALVMASLGRSLGRRFLAW